MAQLVSLLQGDYLTLVLIIFFGTVFIHYICYYALSYKETQTEWTCCEGHVIGRPGSCSTAGLAILGIAIFSLSILTLFYSKNYHPHKLHYHRYRRTLYAVWFTG
jgi:hypothetical protein